jgi:hypothetical protein
MSALDYRIALLSAGPDPADWDLIETILGRMGIPVGITSEYIEVAESIKVADASRVARGMSYFTWMIKAAKPYQRTALRTYCSNVPSATVYARTLSNDFDVNGDPVWIDTKSELVWPTREDNRLIAIADFSLRFDIIEFL